MAIPTKGEAQDILRPYHPLIWRVIHEAWDEWRVVQALRTSVEMAALLYHRTISNYAFDAIARRAIPTFGLEPKVNLEVESQTFKLIFAGRLCARFKKGGDDKLGSSIPTQAAMAFMDADGVLPGFPPETVKVEFIWLPNEIWTKVESVLVIARDGDRLIWEYEINDLLESAKVIPFSPPPDGPAGPDEVDLVKPKAQPGKKTTGQ